MSAMSQFFSRYPEWRDPDALCEVCYLMWFGPLTLLEPKKARLIKIYFPRESPKVLEQWLFYIHQPSIQALHDSCQNGCHCCMLIWHYAFAPQKDILSKLTAKHPIILHTEVAPDAYYDISWTPEDGSRMEISRGGKQYGHLKFLRLCQQMSELQALNAKPSSCYLANVRLAKLWLARCWINHPRCIQLQIPRMPNRLVDVGPPDGSRDPILVTPTVLSRYVALSHCWGRGSIAMTTTKNIAEREAGIPMASLSKTFQEAIQVTRVFGIRYIWIDSLCILQDSVEEWEYEAAGMGRTYGNALFTIAAANASSGEEGLFPNQDHRLHTPCALKSLDNRPSTEFPMQCIHVVHPVDDKPAGHTAPKGPLFDRAWVLQEEIISHATLSFTGHGMYWNCVGYQANYSDPAANPGLYIPRPIRDAIGYYSQSRAVYQDDEGVKAMSNEKVTINFVKGGPKLMLSSEGIEALYKNWSTLVEEYYKRSITYPSDRLPALAGIAQNLQSTLQGRESPRGKWRPFPAYIGGVWSTDLQRGLLWSPHNYETWLRDHFDSDVLFTAEVSAWRIKPPQLFIGPSVSWCSMLESPVRWNGIYDKGWEGPDKICYIEIKQWSYGSDWKLFGPYWDATLELTCLLRIADIRKGEFLHDPSQDRRRIGRLLKDEIGELPDQIFLMPVLCEPIITMKSWNIYCLALVKTGLNENEYRRVGLAFIAYPNWFGNEIPRVIKMV